jgi:hypothetical protein
MFLFHICAVWLVTRRVKRLDACSTTEGGTRTLVAARGEVWGDHAMTMITFFGEVAVV